MSQGATIPISEENSIAMMRPMVLDKMFTQTKFTRALSKTSICAALVESYQKMAPVTLAISKKINFMAKARESYKTDKNKKVCSKMEDSLKVKIENLIY